MEIQVQIKARSPICHGSLNQVGVGNAVAIRKDRLVNVEGMPLVPCISGNALRGAVRRIIMRGLLSSLDRSDFPPEVWDKLYAALACGGHLTGRERAPSPQEIVNIRSELPPLSVLGSAMFKFLLPGRCSFGFSWLRCKESYDAGLSSKSDIKAGDQVTEIGVCRHSDKEHQDPKATGVTSMPLDIEAISVGSVLESTVGIYPPFDPIEMGCLSYGLSKIEYIGGKIASGFGRVDVIHDGDPKPYVDWLSSLSKKELKSRLTSLATRFV